LPSKPATACLSVITIFLLTTKRTLFQNIFVLWKKINIKKFRLGEMLGYAVAHLVQALLQKPERCYSIPEKQSEIVH
jgi:hypothetical protein